MSGGGHWQRSSEELLHALAVYEERIRRDYAESLKLIAELATRDAAVEVGYPNLPALLRDVLRISPTEARRRLTHASAVTETPLVSGCVAPVSLPATAAALQEGVLGADHIEVIARTLGDLPLHVRDADRELAERTLVEAAHSMDARTLTKVGHRVRAWLNEDGTPPADRELAEPVNELHLHVRRDGRLALRGDFDPEASALITTVLSPLARPRPSDDTGPDPRSAAERQGDALVEVFHLVAAEGALPSEGGEKPHVMVTVPLDTLRTNAGRTVTPHLDRNTLGYASPDGNGSRSPVPTRRGPGQAILDGIGPIDAESARRIACDARIIPVVLGSRSEPLDLGRASYTVSTALRRALILRDGGCAFPGCDRTHRWCHSHHIRHWADDGPTEPDNLVVVRPTSPTDPPLSVDVRHQTRPTRVPPTRIRGPHSHPTPQHSPFRHRALSETTLGIGMTRSARRHCPPFMTLPMTEKDKRSERRTCPAEASTGAPNRGHHLAQIADTMFQNDGHGVSRRRTRCVETTDTVCRNDGHGVSRRRTRCVETTDTVCRDDGHGVSRRRTRATETPDTRC